MFGKLCCGLTRAKLADTAPVTHVQHALQALFIRIHHQATAYWNCAHKVVELPLDSFQVVKNICVVELEVVQNRGAGTVMDEFATFVKKCCVVLVGFNYERGAMHLAIAPFCARLSQAR